MKAIDILDRAFDDIAKHARDHEEADLIDKAVDQMPLSLPDYGDIARLVLGMVTGNPVSVGRAAGRIVDRHVGAHARAAKTVGLFLGWASRL
jgi:hypothetical protein